ncbi:acyltransferase [Nonlabens sp.]|uniref:acyltransferase family protein n=1 Tax=Nonlabens sp. TaxID=1888209 RepID=UPI001BCE7327|nr:acyltransferase [Nonlabens sp.]
MHLKPLTSLRFLFALMVFVSHLDFLRTSDYHWLRTTYQDILVEGYIGVSFFFILSGFILTHAYHSKINTSNPENKKFFIARIARIYPLHFVTFLIAVPLMFWGQEIDGKGWLLGLSNSTLTQSYVPIKELYFSFNGPSWSISCEFFFYLCFPFLLRFFDKIGQFKYYLTGVLVLAILILPDFIDQQWHHGLFYINPLFRVVDFILGIVLYDFYVHLKSKKVLINFTKLELFSIGVFMLFFSLRHSVSETALYSVFYWFPMMGIILVFAFQKGRLSKFLSHQYAIWLGEISFGFYMLHHLVLRYFTLGNGKLEWITNDYIIIGLLLCISMVAAGISHRYFEVPLNKLIRQKWK